jgi:hypothetical protein
VNTVQIQHVHNPLEKFIGRVCLLGPFHTQDLEPMTITLQALLLVEKAEPVQVRFFTLRLRGTNGVCECKMDVKSTWIPTWHSMDHASWITWIIFKAHLLEVGLTQN